MWVGIKGVLGSKKAGEADAGKASLKSTERTRRLAPQSSQGKREVLAGALPQAGNARATNESFDAQFDKEDKRVGR